LNEEEYGESSEIQTHSSSFKINWNNVEPGSLIHLPIDELQRKQNEACIL
jgi:hypothetical protein